MRGPTHETIDVVKIINMCHTQKIPLSLGGPPDRTDLPCLTQEEITFSGLSSTRSCRQCSVWVWLLSLSVVILRSIHVGSRIDSFMDC